jgi:anti-sigma factor ChrR (cupin superfamily)
MTDKICPQEDINLLLTAHGALPWPERLQVQLHRLRCPACRKRYQEFRQTSQALSMALSAGPAPVTAPRPALPLWGAALLCFLALSATVWAARSYFAPPPNESCITDEELLKLQNCPTPSSARHQKK